MIKYKLQYKSYGNNAVLIEWPQQINEDILYNIKSFQAIIENHLSEFVVECIATYASLTIIFKNRNYDEIVTKLKALYKNKEVQKTEKGQLWQLPVCYHKSLGFDLDAYSKAIGLSIKEVISLHCQSIYTLYFIGFLPGFLYLGNLDEGLFLNRKSKPKLTIPKGSVGIGGQQTGIYPQASPGGWHIIGNCPVNLFNLNEKPPSVFRAGDQIQFYEISLDDFRQNKFSVLKNMPDA